MTKAKRPALTDYIKASEDLKRLGKDIRALDIAIGNSFAKNIFNGFALNKSVNSAGFKLKERMYKNPPDGLEEIGEDRWDMFDGVY